MELVGQGLQGCRLHGGVWLAATLGARLAELGGADTALSVNVWQLHLMSSVRASILEKRFPDFVRDFMRTMYGHPTFYPSWAREALASVGITLDEADGDSTGPRREGMNGRN